MQQTLSIQSTVTLVPGLNTFVLTSVNSCGTDVETITVNYQNCIAPVINVIAPISNGTTVTSASFSLNATIVNSNNGQGITLTRNSVPVTNFTFNNGNGSFQSTVTLVPGLNTFVLTIINSCGTDTETITINYDNCVPPVITITNPTANGTTVTSSVLNLGALIQNANNGQGTTLNINGRTISNFTFLSATGVFQSTLNLTPGLNTIVLTSVNGCGTDTETITINYDNCVPPIITITNPIANGTTTTNASFGFSATVQNVVLVSGLTLTLNGVPVEKTNFNSGTGVLLGYATLSPGINTFILTATNACGTVTQTITVNYDDCIPPTISITNPAVNGTTVSTPTFGFSALIQHTNNGQGITLTQNNTAITGFDFNNNLSTLQAVTTLIPGLNTFVISATNSCGNDSKTVTIFYVEPVVEDQIISICHHPPGNPENTENLQIPLSAWPAHQAHGDNLGACPENEENDDDNDSGSGEEGENNTEGTGLTNEIGNSQKITICHHPPGNPENTQTLEIPLSAWPAHQAHGDALGACPAQNNNDGGSNESEGGGNGNAGEEGNKTPQNGGKENPKGGIDKTIKPGEVKPIDEKIKPEVIPPTPPKIEEGKGG
jgi:hypothetical protein